jgi:CBS domain-containing protein
MSETGTAALLVVNKANRILGVITESILLSALLRGGM